ncbi:hypothetical protein [Candidatus Neptunichlamydia sp. REUL1]|uniref:hypothetical protein n=1 Tax=Candidatus Neptunichlamydia sp. REUL1 TaxID=3064277 RepID=UPI00292E1F9F|nr:hypothetical protein [Candidatus Neptunochlamydia sp. REUL1]
MNLIFSLRNIDNFFYKNFKYHLKSNRMFKSELNKNSLQIILDKNINKTDHQKPRLMTTNDYPLLFTNKGYKVFFHGNILGKTIAEKRIHFVAMNLLGYLLEKQPNVDLQDLVESCNIRNLKCNASSLKSSFLSEKNRVLFSLIKNTKTVSVGLTPEGVKKTLNLADRLCIDLEAIDIPEGKLKDILIIFKSNNWEDKIVSMKLLYNFAEKNNLKLSGIKPTIFRSHQYFIIFSKSAIKLSPKGLISINLI